MTGDITVHLHLRLAGVSAEAVAAEIATMDTAWLEGEMEAGKAEVDVGVVRLTTAPAAGCSSALRRAVVASPILRSPATRSVHVCARGKFPATSPSDLTAPLPTHDTRTLVGVGVTLFGPHAPDFVAIETALEASLKALEAAEDPRHDRFDNASCAEVDQLWDLTWSAVLPGRPHQAADAALMAVDHALTEARRAVSGKVQTSVRVGLVAHPLEVDLGWKEDSRGGVICPSCDMPCDPTWATCSSCWELPLPRPTLRNDWLRRRRPPLGDI